jgi:hypothetical protein
MPQLGHVVDVNQHRTGSEAACEAGVGSRPDGEHDAARGEVSGLVEDAGGRMGRESLEHRIEHQHGGKRCDRRSAWDLHWGLDHSAPDRTRAR